MVRADTPCDAGEVKGKRRARAVRIASIVPQPRHISPQNHVRSQIMDMPTRQHRPEAPATSRPRRTCGAALVMLALWVAYAIWQQWGHWAEDLSALYIAGHLWQTGQIDLIYAAPPGFFGGAAPNGYRSWTELGITDKISFPYVYPPIWVVLIAPLTSDSRRRKASPMLSRCCSPDARRPRSCWPARLLQADHDAAVGSGRRSASSRSWPAHPVLRGTLAQSADDHRQLPDPPRLDQPRRRNRPVAAGAALALAAALKLTPAAFVLVFLIDRQYRAHRGLRRHRRRARAVSASRWRVPTCTSSFSQASGSPGHGPSERVNVSLLPALLAAGSALGLRAPLRSAKLPCHPATTFRAGSTAGLSTRRSRDPRGLPPRARDRSPARSVAASASSRCRSSSRSSARSAGFTTTCCRCFLLPGLFGLLSLRVATLLALAVAHPLATLQSSSRSTACPGRSRITSGSPAPPGSRSWSRSTCRQTPRRAPFCPCAPARLGYNPGQFANWGRTDAEKNRYQVDHDHRSRAHRHRTGLRVRLFRRTGLQGAARGRLPGHPGQLQPRHDHDRSRHGGCHLYRTDHPGNRRQDHRKGTPRRASADDGRADRPQHLAGARRYGCVGQVQG